jgi:hypothetical protein
MSYSHPVFFFDESEQSTREETGRLGQRLNDDGGEWPWPRCEDRASPR